MFRNQRNPEKSIENLEKLKKSGEIKKSTGNQSRIRNLVFSVIFPSKLYRKSFIIIFVIVGDCSIYVWFNSFV